MKGGTDGRIQRMRPLPGRRSSIVSVLDVGTSKVTAIIARLTPRAPGEVLPGRTHAMEVLGFGAQRSRGIKAGVVVDLDEAERAVRSAVEAAERAAGLTVDSLIVGVACGRLASETFSATVELGQRAAAKSDIRRVLAAGSGHSVHDSRTIIHSVPVGYALDGNRGIRDPRGMVGGQLGIDMHVVTADAAPVRNLELAVNRAHLQVETMVATPYASGLATLIEDEAQLGAACIDMGGGRTSIGVFADGNFVHVDGIGIGGHHVTLDLARGLSTGLAAAERIKVLHGGVIGGSDDSEPINVPQVGDERDAPIDVPRSLVVEIIRPRVEEILESVRDRLSASGFASRVAGRIVLTGGASQLTGLADLARRIFGSKVRLGRPVGIAGMPAAARGAPFAGAVGLLIYPQVGQIEQVQPVKARSAAAAGGGGYLARVGGWLKDSF